MRIGSLCAGYEGLGMAIQATLGGDIVWHAETDKDASRILAHHWPGTPNYGDLTTLAWAAHPVDVLAAGFPCQPVSGAGKRKGVNDERWLFDDIVAGIGRMDPRPRLLVFENVLGLLSANGGDALARVIQGMASVGYVGRYGVLPASAAGAPHRRLRWFCVAWPATDADDAGRQQYGRPVAVRPQLAAAQCGGDAAPDTGRERHGRGQDGRALGRVDGDDAGEARQRERTREVAGDRGAAAAADASGNGRHEGWAEPAGLVGRPDAALGGTAVRWGAYEPAIRRWESLTRPAPAPTEPGAKGQPRLSPRFVEWLMGLPAGHVTDVAISRNAQLKALGNGVVPQQAALALRWLLFGEWAAVGQHADVLPTPQVSSTRTGRDALLGTNHNGQWSALGLEQAIEVAAGTLPREFRDWSEIRGRAGRTGGAA